MKRGQGSYEAHLMLAFSALLIPVAVALVYGLRKMLRPNSDYTSLAITLIGTFVGFTLAIQAAKWQEQETSRERLRGMLESAAYASARAQLSVERRIAMAEKLMDAASKTLPQTGYFGTRPIFIPSVLEAVLLDGTSFGQLSEPLRLWLPGTIVRLKDLIALFRPESNVPSELETLYMIRAELLMQVQCLNAEIRLLRGELDKESHAEEIAASRQQHLRSIEKHTRSMDEFVESLSVDRPHNKPMQTDR